MLKSIHRLQNEQIALVKGGPGSGRRPEGGAKEDNPANVTYDKYIKAAREYWDKNVPNVVPDADDLRNTALDFMSDDGLRIGAEEEKGVHFRITGEELDTEKMVKGGPGSGRKPEGGAKPTESNPYNAAVNAIANSDMNPKAKEEGIKSVIQEKQRKEKEGGSKEENKSPTKKDFSDNVVYSKGSFYIDRQDINSGKRLVKPGDTVSFTSNGKSYSMIVSGTTVGRNDDMYELTSGELE